MPYVATLYVTGHELHAFTHMRRAPMTHTLFKADEQGLVEFAEYLKLAGELPVCMVVDVVEEEYRFEVIPHLRNRERRALLERKLAQVLRGTPFRHAVPQGRLTEGRRDDEVLCVGLTKPDLLSPWLRVIQASRVSLGAIYSLPLLSEKLLAALPLKIPPMLLLVTEHAGSGMRQTFFQQGRVKMSRLISFNALDQQDHVATIVAEVDKTRRYLARQRLLTMDKALDVCVLIPEERRARIKGQFQDSNTERYCLAALDEVAAGLGMSGSQAFTTSDALFAHLAATSDASNHYARDEDQKFFRQRRLRYRFQVATVVLGLASAFWSGANVVDAMVLGDEAARVEVVAQEVNARYLAVRQQLPSSSLGGAQLKALVDTAEEIKRERRTPQAMLEDVSREVTGFRNLRLNRLEWQTSASPDVVDPAVQAEGEQAAEAPESQQGLGSRYQSLLLYGEVTPFSGDYRAAVDLVRSFAARLEKSGKFLRVAEVALPLNLSPDGQIRGDLGAFQDNMKAEFVLRVVREVPDGAA